MKDNTVSQCIGTVAATYGCKILQLYECDANVYGYDGTANDTPRIPAHTI